MPVHRFIAWTFCAFVLTVAPPTYAAPCAGFVDVQDTDPFCTHITWLHNRAITLGCTANEYCPTQFVRRDQMAAFLYRLGVQNAFLQGGNAFNAPAILGTTDAGSLHLNVNGARALALMPAANSAWGSIPNLVGGHPANNVVNCFGCLPTPEPPVGATVGGGGSTGSPNRVTDSFGVVAGGFGNRAGNDTADHNDARGATVSGGNSNVASGLISTVGGGFNNDASGAFAMVAGGHSNQASGSSSTVAGGLQNEATGDYSLAAGRRAKAVLDGCFVWGDSTNADTSCTAANQFVARATGGVLFATAVNASGTATAGVDLVPGDSSWNVVSDRAAKTNWRDVDGRDVLDKLASMPIGEWSYLAQSDAIRHIGPSAQDFRAAFGLGHGDRTISTVDADGVALAAIQGLNRKLEQEIATLAARNAALEVALRELAADVRALKAVGHD